jgi:hypothetical protein
MRILCGLDPQYTGEVTVYEETLDREAGGGEGIAENAVQTVGSARDSAVRGSSDSSLLRRSPLMVESAVHNSGGQDRPSAGSQRSFYFRDVLLFFLTLSIRWSATARRFINKRVDILFPPKERRVRRCVGWCSQEDALFEYLSVREHIELFESLLGDSEAINCGSADTAASLDDMSEAVPVQELFLQKKFKRFLSFFTAVEQEDVRRSAQLRRLSRLRMVEHAEKMAMELSG